jgi:hypothetical protein
MDFHVSQTLAEYQLVFQNAENLTDLVRADYRVRTQIRESLENIYFRSQNQAFAAHIAF